MTDLCNGLVEHKLSDEITIKDTVPVTELLQKCRTCFATKLQELFYADMKIMIKERK